MSEKYIEQYPLLMLTHSSFDKLQLSCLWSCLHLLSCFCHILILTLSASLFVTPFLCSSGQLSVIVLISIPWLILSAWGRAVSFYPISMVCSGKQSVCSERHPFHCSHWHISASRAGGRGLGDPRAHPHSVHLQSPVQGSSLNLEPEVAFQILYLLSVLL